MDMPSLRNRSNRTFRCGFLCLATTTTAKSGLNDSDHSLQYPALADRFFFWGLNILQTKLFGCSLNNLPGAIVPVWQPIQLDHCAVATGAQKNSIKKINPARLICFIELPPH
jgi:hypothetical protein